ncbi:spore germination protein [Metabacillus litoralis]|jgi:spore germination protein PF|uniref:spore germination protein n=1 Tax=Metabacillus litoralis TaxID=152268 RepID=UPI00203E9DF0|nr:spore germination protein [Metabacillus litoralis]MCM3653464.1 spore germination protein [Metabacillus litoralis]
MTSIVGPIKINSVSGGVVTSGDTFNISPKSTSKTISGSGGGNTGNFIIVNNGISITNGVDPDVKDQDQTANL